MVQFEPFLLFALLRYLDSCTQKMNWQQPNAMTTANAVNIMKPLPLRLLNNI